MDNFLMLVVAVLCIWTLISFLDILFKSCMLYPYIYGLDKLGITLTPGKFCWHTSYFNKWFQKLSTVNVTFTRMWFTLGALLGIVSIIPSIVLLCTTAYGGIIATAHGKDTTANTEQLLVAMVPGINIPLSELCYYFVTLLLCSTVHEVGHAVASCCEGVGVQRCGLFVIAVIPAAFVDIPSRQLNRIGTFKQLRIFCAGIWHNVILTGVAYLILISVPLLSEPFYSQNAGVYVTSVVQGSSVGGIAGLVDGDTITQINDCLVENKSDWVSCLSNTISQKQGYCVPEIAVSETEVLSHIANRSHYDKYFCCPIDNPSAFCFDTRRQQKDKMCLNARLILMESRAKCNATVSCKNPLLTCITPLLENHTRLIIVHREDKEFVIFLGHPSEIYHSVFVSNYIPRSSYVPAKIPVILETLMNYIVLFSSGLGLLNAVPCLFLDGQHITYVTVELLFSRYIQQENRLLLAKAIIIFGTLTLVLNVILSILRIL